MMMMTMMVMVTVNTVKAMMMVVMRRVMMMVMAMMRMRKAMMMVVFTRMLLLVTASADDRRSTTLAGMLTLRQPKPGPGPLFALSFLFRLVFSLTWPPTHTHLKLRLPSKTQQNNAAWDKSLFVYSIQFLELCVRNTSSSKAMGAQAYKCVQRAFVLRLFFAILHCYRHQVHLKR